MADAPSTSATQKPRPMRLRFYKVQMALERLVDLNNVLNGKNPEYIPVLANLSKQDAKILYNRAADLVLADILLSPDDIRTSKCSTIIDLATTRGKIDGLESIFITAISILNSQGKDDLVKSAYQLIDKGISIDNLSGDNLAALVYSASGKKLVGITKGGMDQMIGADDAPSRLGPNNDVDATIDKARARGRGPDYEACVAIVKSAAESAGAIIASSITKRVGKGVETASDSIKLPPDTGKIGAFGIEKAGEFAGATAAGKASEQFAETLCSGIDKSDPIPSAVENEGPKTGAPIAPPQPPEPPPAVNPPSSSGGTAPPPDGPSAGAGGPLHGGGGHVPGQPEEEEMPVHRLDGDPGPDENDQTNTPAYGVLYGLPFVYYPPDDPGGKHQGGDPHQGAADELPISFDVSEWPRIKLESVDGGPMVVDIDLVKGPVESEDPNPKFDPKHNMGDPVLPSPESGPVIVPQVPDKGGWFSRQRWRNFLRRRDNG